MTFELGVIFYNMYSEILLLRLQVVYFSTFPFNINIYNISWNIKNTRATILYHISVLVLN